MSKQRHCYCRIYSDNLNIDLVSFSADVTSSCELRNYEHKNKAVIKNCVANFPGTGTVQSLFAPLNLLQIKAH